MPHQNHTIEGLTRFVRELEQAQCGSTATDVEAAAHYSVDLLASGVPVYRHPLGFLHLELTEFLSPSHSFDRARLHFFEQDYRRFSYTPSEAHSHRWHLKSCILLGTLVNATYDFVSEDEGGLIEGYVDYQPEGHDRLFPRSRSGSVQVKSMSRHDRGAVYCQEPDVLHTTAVESTVAATLLLAKDTEHQARVVMPYGAKTSTTARQRATDFDVGRFLEALERMLG